MRLSMLLRFKLQFSIFIENEVKKGLVTTWNRENKCTDKKRYYGKILDNSECNDLFLNVDDQYLRGGITYFSKGLSSLFCLASNRLPASYNFVKKEFEAKKTEDFANLLNSYGQSKLETVFKRTPMKLPADNNMLMPGTTSLITSAKKPITWFLPDSMGMCYKTELKFRATSDLTTKCTQKVYTDSENEMNLYRIAMANSPTASGSINLSPPYTFSNSAGPISINEYVFLYNTIFYSLILL